MADRKISELSAMSAGGQATGDLLTIVDVSEAAAADKNKKITVESLFQGIPGDVGINTSSPGRTLDVNGVIRSDGTSGRFELGGNSSTPSVGAAIHRPANNTLAFVTNSSEKMRLDSDGRLLVGRTSELNVGAGSAATTEIQNSSGFNLSLISTLNSSGAGGLAIGKARGGSVVQDDDDLGSIVFAGHDGTDFETRGASIAAQVDGTPGSNDMPGRLVFSTTADGASSPTERVRIDSEGRVHAGGTGAMQLGTICSRSTDGTGPSNDGNQRHALVLGSTQTAGLNVGPTIYFYGKTNNTTADYGFAGIQGCKGSTSSNDYTGHLRFFTQNAGGAGELSEMCRITQDGLTFNGDTGSVNALDDYEEGTYTGTITCGTSGTITINSSYDQIAYEKIGRMCTVHGRLRISAVSSPVGTAIVNLPFARDSITEDAGRIGGTVIVQNMDEHMNKYGIHPTGATGVELCRTDSIAPGLTPASNFNSNSFVYISVTYRTAT